MPAGMKIITKNRKAFHDYTILETNEAGIALVGTEVKSLRLGNVNLKDSYARVERGEVVLYGLHISPYDHGNRYNHDPERPRRLLLHRREITRLKSRTEEKGLTLVPLSLYFKGGRAKVELGLAKGKQIHDKRETLRKRETELDMEQAIRRQSREQQE
ncbi:MAG TPA: SsrA-binding protein SmpB [Candidatus Latescibacteria bacterium]|nr:MAG: SsrA-binding protein [Candidatus Latescibacteria bacterium ADurb.Bin168]HPU85870.1 SsrA-binding protein SmpB [Candidatus Latescibacterota bacterium]